MVDERLIAVEDNVDSWNEGLERTTALEALIDENKIAGWDKAEENVQADWNEEDETADAFIKNKPDLNAVINSTTFDYIYAEETTAMTISMLMEKIAELEARIAILEYTITPEPDPEEPEPEPEEPTPEPEEPEVEEPTPEPEAPEEEVIE